MEILKDTRKLQYSVTHFLIPTGRTDAVPIGSGVKQGCPISPILFNLTLELVIRAVNVAASANQLAPVVHGQSVSIMAYADDLVIMSKSADGLQRLLSTASIMADKLQLKFKPAKCASLSMECRKRPVVRSVEFLVQGNVIPALSEEQHYRYLGVHHLFFLSFCPNFVKSNVCVWIPHMSLTF